MDEHGSTGQDTDQVTRGQFSAIVGVAAMVVPEVIALIAEQQRRAAARGEAQARAAQRDLRRRYLQDRRTWRRGAISEDPAARNRWWQKATVHEVGSIWGAVCTWSPIDEEAAAARQVIAAELQKRGADVTDPEARPGDVEWLRANTNLRDSDPHDQELSRFEAAEAEHPRIRQLIREHFGTEDSMTSELLESPWFTRLAYQLWEHEQLGGDPREMIAALDLEWPNDPCAGAEWQVEQANERLEAAARGGSRQQSAVAAAAPGIEAGADPEVHRQAALDIIDQRIRFIDKTMPRLREVPADVIAKATRIRDEFIEAREAIATSPRPVVEIRRRAREVRRHAEVREVLAAIAEHADPVPQTARVAAPSVRLRPEDRARYADMFRDRFADAPEAVSAVVNSPGWGTLAARLHAHSNPAVLVNHLHSYAPQLAAAGVRDAAGEALRRLDHWQKQGRPSPRDRRLSAVAAAHPGTSFEAARAGGRNAARSKARARARATRQRVQPRERQ